MKFILKCEVMLFMISLIIISTFVHITVPYLAMTSPVLPNSQMWWNYGVLELGSYTTSLQILAIITCIMALRPLWSSLTLLIYLLIGFAGVPVFFHGGGQVYFSQGTLGYLLSFLGAACFSGFFLKRIDGLIPRSSYLLTGFVSLLFIHGVGGIYASVFFQMVPIEYLLRYAVPQLFWQTMALFVLSWCVYQIQVFFHVEEKEVKKPKTKRRSVSKPSIRKWRKSA